MELKYARKETKNFDVPMTLAEAHFVQSLGAKVNKCASALFIQSFWRRITDS